MRTETELKAAISDLKEKEFRISLVCVELLKLLEKIEENTRKV